MRERVCVSYKMDAGIMRIHKGLNVLQTNDQFVLFPEEDKKDKGKRWT